MGRSYKNRTVQAKPKKDRAIGKASMWDRRYAHSPRPPHNATVDDWFPQFGGALYATGEDEEDDSLPEDQNARSLFKSTQNRIKAFELVKHAQRRRPAFSEEFLLPDGCVPLHKRTWREAFEADRKKPQEKLGDLDDVAGDDADDDQNNECSAAACPAELVFDWRVQKSGTTTLYEALAAHPRIAPMYPEPHTHGETHVWSPPQGRTSCATTARIRCELRTGLASPEKVASEEGFGWEMAVRELKRWSLTMSWSTRPHYLVLGGLRDKICSSLQLGNVNCMNARYIAMLRDPAKRAFSQYVMKTHMRVALYNDRRTFWKAVTDGMKHTADYSKCWDDALGYQQTSRAHMRWPGRGEKNRRPGVRKVRPHQLPREPLPGLRVEVGLLLSTVTVVRALPFASLR